mgnify:CR=1 FL=1
MLYAERVFTFYKHKWEENQLKLERTFTKAKVDAVSISTSDDYVKALLKLFKMRAKIAS